VRGREKEKNDKTEGEIMEIGKMIDGAIKMLLDKMTR
jgi:hypothetical protein